MEYCLFKVNSPTVGIYNLMIVTSADVIEALVSCTAFSFSPSLFCQFIMITKNK